MELKISDHKPVSASFDSQVSARVIIISSFLINILFNYTLSLDKIIYIFVCSVIQFSTTDTNYRHS